MTLGLFAKLAMCGALLSGLFLSSINAAAQPAPEFQTEQQVLKHCPTDTVVWVNTRTGVYHFKGQRWYGNTEYGTYECRKDANAEGDRATRNGQ